MPKITVDLNSARQSFPRRTAAVPALVALAFLAPLGGCSGILDPAGPVGAAQKLILINSVAIMLAIVLPVMALIAGFAFWFRASNPRAFYWPEWEFSGHLELIVWAIPALVVVVLGGVAWFGSHDLDPFKPLPGKAKPVEIQVVALDWKWLFIYPDEGIASVNGPAVPVGVPIHFIITSSGVMNSFFVPRLGSQIYAMAGMAIAALVAGRRDRELPRLLGELQRPGIRRHAFRPEGAARRVTTPSGSATPRRRARTSTAPAMPSWSSRASTSAPAPIARSIPGCSNPS